MIVVEPFEGERINVSYDELADINAVVDASAGTYSRPTFIVDLFDAAKADNYRRKVYLRSEGWHQYEPYKGSYYKHVTLHYAKWTYHFYTKVSSRFENITSEKHRIDTISYMDGNGSKELNPG